MNHWNTYTADMFITVKTYIEPATLLNILSESEMQTALSRI